MISNKPVVQLLARFLEQVGVRKVVISPGSRNAPLIITLTNWKGFDCYSVVDERSAGYYALGMSKQAKEPVAIVCTSGTAVLNLAPALAEAYYQEIPLIAITADRPAEWIDHEDGQTIRQANVFSNFIKFGCTLPGEYEKNAIDKCFNLLCDAGKTLLENSTGPIHLNIPLEEPLYHVIDKKTIDDRTFGFQKARPLFASYLGLEKILNTTDKVLLVAGVLQPDAELNTLVNNIAGHLNIPVIAALTSNLSGKNIFNTPDTLLAQTDENALQELKPEVLITIGGPVVSKRLKQFIRTNKPAFHFDIDTNPSNIDTYRCLTHKIISEPVPALQFILDTCSVKPITYIEKWRKMHSRLRLKNSKFFADLPWSDLWIFHHLFNNHHLKGHIHLANSTPVRYAEMFDKNCQVNYYANRGTSGIDGCVSTAAGAALVSNDTTYIITGDIGFIYDSNALFNNRLPENLKIIIINNGGGGIFELLPGPAKTNAFDYFKTPHQTAIDKICQAFQVDYFKAGSIESFRAVFENFENSGCCSVLELQTLHVDNASIYKQYFSYLRSI